LLTGGFHFSNTLRGTPLIPPDVARSKGAPSGPRRIAMVKEDDGTTTVVVIPPGAPSED
jgi:hypothetical protein